MHKPTEKDAKHLSKLAQYVNGTRDLKLRFAPSDGVLRCSIDASYNMHPDAKGHTGAAIYLGGWKAPFIVVSKKQTHVASSSTEAELIALSDGVKHLIWAKGMCEEIGVAQPMHLVVQQDNKSTITLIKGTAAHKSKSINAKLFWTRQYSENKEIDLQYVESEKIRADPLTKCVKVKWMFTRWRNDLLNI